MSDTATSIAEEIGSQWKPYPVYKDSGIEWLGEIPEHWTMKRLKFLTSFVTSGSRGWAQYYSDNGAIFLRIGNLSRTSIDLDLRDIQYVCPPQDAEGERTRVNQHDVLISITAYIGSVGLVAEDIGEAYVNQHIALTRPRKNVVVPKWLGYCLLSQVGREQFHLLLYGGTKDGLGLDDVNNLLVLMPPMCKQRTIATFLDHETAHIDTLIAKKERLIELLTEKRSALISHAVTKGLDPTVPMKDSGVECIGEIPVHWKVKKAKFCLRTIEQGWSPQCENRSAEPEEWGVLKVGCVNGAIFDPSENKALPLDTEPRTEYEIRQGDVLMSRANTRELLGSTSVVAQVRSRLLLCDKLYRLKVLSTEVNPIFLVLLLGSTTARFQLEREATGASDSMQNIGMGTVRNLVLALPPLTEQCASVAFLDRETAQINNLISKVREHIEKLKEYRAALISAAVTGKIDIRKEVA